MLVAVAEGRFSLQAVILASMALFWIVACLFAYMFLFRTYQRLRSGYRARRRKLYEPAIEKVLMEEPLDAVVAALRPKRWGDEDMVQEVMIDAMRYLKGPPFEALRDAAQKLGLVERNLRMLRSRSKHRRGTAMEALGLLRAPQALVGIISILDREPMDMQLVALRSLAAIGNPATLPYFVKTADKLSPAMIVRLASLMMEFGAAARPHIQDLVDRHRGSFPPRVMEELLKEIAADTETELR